MSGLLGGSSAQSAQVEVYTGIQVSTSMYAEAIPLVYGRQRVPFNLLWYGNFTAKGSSSGGGKGGSSSGTSYSYSAAWAAAICMGPIVGINQIWHDKSLETLDSENLTLFLGEGGQETWSFLETYTPPGASFSGYISGDALYVTALASGNLSNGLKISGTGVAANTTITDMGGEGGGIGSYTVSVSQTVGSSTDPISMTASGGVEGSQAVPYDHICYVATSAYNLGSSASMPNLNFEVDAFLGYDIAAGMYDADPSAVIPDYLTDPNHGAGFRGAIDTGLLTGPSNTYQAYVQSLGLLLSPYENTQRQANDFLQEILQITNSDAVLSVGTLKIIPYADAPVSGTTADGSSWSYTPNLTPIFIFDDDDYMPKKGDPPIKLTRKALKETYNVVNIEFVDRSDYYNTSIAGASDLGDIGTNGIRMMDTLSFHEITSAGVARTAAQLILNTSLYERNTYQFNLGIEYSLLEPMDYVAVNDANLGLVNQVLRITKVQDSDQNLITIDAMEIPGTVRNTPVYNWASAAGYAANFAVNPGNVAAPVIFQMPPIPACLTEGITLGIAVCGPTSSAEWGGCQVWCSVDGGNTYGSVGVVTSPAIYGTLGAELPEAESPDTTSTLSVILANSSAQIGASTDAEAQAMTALALIGSGSTAEVLSYGSATLVEAGEYGLTYLLRGLYGSVDQEHGSGSNFVRLDENIFQIAMDPGMAGRTIYFKFLSFNQAGQAVQELSAATAYPYTIPPGPVAGFATLVPSGSSVVAGANVYKAANGASAWDSACETSQPYTALSISATYAAGAELGVGLATSISPTLQPGTAGLNYSILANTAGDVTAYVGATAIYTGSAPRAGDVYQLSYDGFTVRFFVNAVEVYAQPAQGLSLYGVLVLYSPGALFSNVEVATQTASTPIEWVATGTCVVAGNSLAKPTGAATWDSCAYSILGYPSCHISAKLNSTAAQAGIGLSTNPTGYAADAAAGTLYKFPNYSLANGGGDTWQIWESGTNIGSYGAVQLTDLAAITYDGSNINYWLNGTNIRTVSAAGLMLYGFCPVYTEGAGSGLNSLAFGAGATVGIIDTSGLGADAASQIVVATAVGPTDYSLLPGAVNAQPLTAVIATSGNPVGVDVSCTVSAGLEHCTWNSPIQVLVYRDGSQVGTAYFDVYGYVTDTEGSGGPAVGWTMNAALLVVDDPPAGVHTYGIALNAAQASEEVGSLKAVISFSNMSLKVREYKK